MTALPALSRFRWIRWIRWGGHAQVSFLVSRQGSGAR